MSRRGETGRGGEDVREFPRCFSLIFRVRNSFNIDSINLPVRLSASLMTISSSTVGSDLPFWLTLYTMRLSAAGDEDEKESGGNRSEYDTNRINLIWCVLA